MWLKLFEQPQSEHLHLEDLHLEHSHLLDLHLSDFPLIHPAFALLDMSPKLKITNVKILL